MMGRKRETAPSNNGNANSEGTMLVELATRPAQRITSEAELIFALEASAWERLLRECQPTSMLVRRRLGLD